MFFFDICLYFLFTFCLVFYSIYFCFVKRFDQLWKGAIVSIVYYYFLLFTTFIALLDIHNGFSFFTTLLGFTGFVFGILLSIAWFTSLQKYVHASFTPSLSRS